MTVVGGLQPSDAARLGNGRGILVLERLWLGGSWGKQVSIKVQHVTDEQLFSGRMIDPRLMLELKHEMHHADNFEGIAVQEEADGAKVRVVLIHPLPAVILFRRCGTHI